MKYFLALLLLLGALAARAAGPIDTSETWKVEGQTFYSEALAKRYIIASGKRVDVEHSRCEILSNGLKFKKCPKLKEKAFENEQFKSITEKN